MGGSARRTWGGLLLALVAPLLVGAADHGSNLDARLLAAHNRERAAAAVPALRWSPELAVEARAWADHLGRTGGFEHADGIDTGENLWAGTARHYAPEDMVGLWVAEKRHFQAGRFPANSRTGRVGDVGHYTQLMWRGTDQVGCALARGREDEVLVCRYSHAGNVIGRTPF